MAPDRNKDKSNTAAGAAKGRRIGPGTGPALRSRGFLSHPGGPATGDGNHPCADANGSQTPPASRSRGTRSAFASSEGKPEALSVPKPVKPYKLDNT